MQDTHQEYWTKTSDTASAHETVDRLLRLVGAVDERAADGQIESGELAPTDLQAVGRYVVAALERLQPHLLACDDCLLAAGDATPFNPVGDCGSSTCQDIQSAVDLKHFLLYGPDAFVNFHRQFTEALAAFRRTMTRLRTALASNETLAWNLEYGKGATVASTRAQAKLDDLHYRLAVERLGLPDAGDSARVSPAAVAESAFHQAI